LKLVFLDLRTIRAPGEPPLPTPVILDLRTKPEQGEPRADTTPNIILPNDEDKPAEKLKEVPEATQKVVPVEVKEGDPFVPTCGLCQWRAETLCRRQGWSFDYSNRVELYWPACPEFVTTINTRKDTACF
jgi:hypothetical protein